MRAFPIDAKRIATLDRLLHEPVRLSITACLSLLDEADFVFLQSQTGITGGNLSSHIKKLERSGYVSIRKGFKESRPRTTIRLTPTGRNALTAYVGAMRDLLAAIDDGGAR